jgi:hypothetical protein
MSKMRYGIVPAFWFLIFPAMAAAGEQATPVIPENQQPVQTEILENADMLKDLEMFENFELFAESKDEQKSGTEKSKEAE